MSGVTTANGKFLKSLSEKLTYQNARNRCDGEGLMNL